MLKKYVSYALHKIDYANLEIREDISYVEVPVKILDKKQRVLRTKTIPMVKVLWRNHALEEATWELESKVKEKYPGLFEWANFEDEIPLRRGGYNNQNFS